MEQARIGKIAYELVKMHAKQRFNLGELSDPKKMKEMISELSDEIPVPEKDLAEFAKILFNDLLAEARNAVLNLAD